MFVNTIAVAAPMRQLWLEKSLSYPMPLQLMPKQISKLQAGKKATKLKLVDKFIKTRCSKINTELVSLKIYKTNFKIYFKKCTSLPTYLRIRLLTIILLVKVYLKYRNVKDESSFLVRQVNEPLNRRNFLEFFLSL